MTDFDRFRRFAMLRLGSFLRERIFRKVRFDVLKRTHFRALPPTGEGGSRLRKKKEEDVAARIAQLAFGKANDAVKLVFLDPEQPEQLEKIEELDLSMVSEVKRGGNGSVEVKLLNRIALLELLAQLSAPSGAAAKNGEAESFFLAMDKAASKLREDGA